MRARLSQLSARGTGGVSKVVRWGSGAERVGFWIGF